MISYSCKQFIDNSIDQRFFFTLQFLFQLYLRLMKLKHQRLIVFCRAFIETISDFHPPRLFALENTMGSESHCFYFTFFLCCQRFVYYLYFAFIFGKELTRCIVFSFGFLFFFLLFIYLFINFACLISKHILLMFRVITPVLPSPFRMYTI